MGYESTLLVVEPLRSLHHDGHTYASIVATIDLCKMPHVFHRRLRERWVKSDLCICMDGSDVSEDMYGDPLLAADLDTAITDLRLADAQIFVEDGERYRRLPPAIALLEGFDQSQWDELLVLHYGH